MEKTSILAGPNYLSVGYKTFLNTVVVGIGFGILGFYLIGPETALGAFFLTIFVAIVVTKFRMNQHFKQYGYGWYSKNFPEHVRSEGRISCRHCSGRHISARNLMNQTFHRSHFCNSCGETLYYSPER